MIFIFLLLSLSLLSSSSLAMNVGKPSIVSAPTLPQTSAMTTWLQKLFDGKLEANDLSVTDVEHDIVLDAGEGNTIWGLALLTDGGNKCFSLQFDLTNDPSFPDSGTDSRYVPSLLNCEQYTFDANRPHWHFWSFIDTSATRPKFDDSMIAYRYARLHFIDYNDRVQEFLGVRELQVYAKGPNASPGDTSEVYDGHDIPMSIAQCVAFSYHARGDPFTNPTYVGFDPNSDAPRDSSYDGADAGARQMIRALTDGHWQDGGDDAHDGDVFDNYAKSSDATYNIDVAGFASTEDVDFTVEYWLPSPGNVGWALAELQIMGDFDWCKGVTVWGKKGVDGTYEVLSGQPRGDGFAISRCNSLGSTWMPLGPSPSGHADGYDFVAITFATQLVGAAPEKRGLRVRDMRLYGFLSTPAPTPVPTATPPPTTPPPATETVETESSSSSASSSSSSQSVTAPSTRTSIGTTSSGSSSSSESSGNSSGAAQPSLLAPLIVCVAVIILCGILVLLLLTRRRRQREYVDDNGSSAPATALAAAPPPSSSQYGHARLDAAAAAPHAQPYTGVPQFDAPFADANYSGVGGDLTSDGYSSVPSNSIHSYSTDTVQARNGGDNNGASYSPVPQFDVHKPSYASPGAKSANSKYDYVAM